MAYANSVAVKAWLGFIKSMPANKPLTKTGGVVGLKGNLAPDGAIVKVAGMTELKFTGPARCFDREEDAFAAVKARKYKEGDVFVIRS